ncbi:ribosome-inactivating family protein [Streptomyces sp. ME02-8801-2C]|uniref:ribosome-inactivating family protein n=1 Tax=Streptomyces sp. ME02-8801-2C TaxID=3028680 RepID=UPI0029A6CE2E|nr:ribosome-inactivating family protein [Streptomyces sp. ME02-8801-2C]MDX3450865.1 ribosome-inactivating family protein [Streptomyces sp. ME02-8801-2C]
MSRFHAIRKLSTTAVTSAALVAVAVTGVSGLTSANHSSPLGSQVKLVDKEVPTDGMSYDMTVGVHRDFANRFDAIINDIRGRLRGTHLYRNIILTRPADDYFPVTLAMGNSQVTLVINARNLYVVGWRNDSTDTYGRLRTGPETYAGARTRNLEWVNYNDMERAAGVGRDSLGISMGTIQGAISDLGSPNSTSAGRNEARSLLILTQALAEGARFDFISYRISQAIRGSSKWYPGTSSRISSNGSSGSGIDVTGIQLENNWDGISRAAQNATHNHRAPNYPIGDGHLWTLEAIDAQLAVAVHHSL